MHEKKYVTNRAKKKFQQKGQLQSNLVSPDWRSGGSVSFCFFLEMQIVDENELDFTEPPTTRTDFSGQHFGFADLIVFLPVLST